MVLRRVVWYTKNCNMGKTNNPMAATNYRIQFLSFFVLITDPVILLYRNTSTVSFSQVVKTGLVVWVQRWLYGALNDQKTHVGHGDEAQQR